MNYDQEILKVLTIAGEAGLKVEKVARHVFNACNSMFMPLNYKEVHAYVSQYLIKNAKDPLSIIEKGEGHGVYHLNFKAQLAQQLLLKFAPHDDLSEQVEADNSEVANKSDELSLSLFD